MYCSLIIMASSNHHHHTKAYVMVVDCSAGAFQFSRPKSRYYLRTQIVSIFEVCTKFTNCFKTFFKSRNMFNDLQIGIWTSPSSFVDCLFRHGNKTSWASALPHSGAVAPGAIEHQRHRKTMKSKQNDSSSSSTLKKNWTCSPRLDSTTLVIFKLV